jgi:hypothetical protein
MEPPSCRTCGTRFRKASWNHGSLLGAKRYYHALVEALNPHWMVPRTTQSIWKVIDKYYMQWMGIWGPQHAVTTTLVGPNLERQSWNHRSLLGAKWYYHALVEQCWMGLWSSHHAATTTLVEADFKRQLKSLITAGWQMIPSCIGWGSKPTLNETPTFTPNI